MPAATALAIRRAVVDVMVADARRALPNECCGLLLARITHQTSAAAADPLAVAGRTFSRRFDVVTTTPAASFGPCDPPQRRLDALATNAGEKCGPGAVACVERAVPARNLRPRPDRYLIDPADHCAALRAARAAGLEVVGAYHSHPDGTLRPSEVDRREASYPEFIYAIVAPDSGGGRRVAAFRLQRDAFEEIRLRVVP